MKKGFIFTLDAIIGLTIAIAVILSFNFFKFDLDMKDDIYQKISYQSRDIMILLSDLKIYEIQDDPLIKQLISENKITNEDMNKSVLDLSSSFFYSGNKTLAGDIVETILNNISSDICVEISISSDSLYQSCNKTSDDEYAVSTRIETGYDMSMPSEGYTARSFLTSLTGKSASEYIYFGGYEGDGNITKIVEIPSDSVIKSVYMELDSGSNFSLYVNGNFSGYYNSSRTKMIPNSWYFCNESNPIYCDNFLSGNNTIQLNFTDSSTSFIGGGYIKINYDTSQLSPVKNINESIFYFPGISGMINIYSSFYIPGDLSYMETKLHFKNNYTTFFNVGNVTIFNINGSSSERQVNFNNSELSSLLNYDFLSKNTIPLRLGTEAFQTIISGFGVGDSVLVTDLSGSMQACSNEPFGSDPHTEWRWTTWSSGGSTYGSWRWASVSSCDDGAERNIEIAKDANNLFVSTVMNTSGNRIGMADYTGSYSVYNYTRGRWITMFPNNLAGSVDLSTNPVLLSNHVNSMETWWGTCICCGINRARTILNDQSNSTRKKSIILMSDGEANIRCSEQGTGDSKDDAILAGQQACANNITVYAIGYGEGADVETLRDIACNESLYYDATDVNDMLEIYRQIAEEVSEASFYAQSINVSGEIKLNNILYPDSYIKFGYDPTLNPLDYGEIEITRETPIIGNMTNYNSTSEYVEGSYYIYPELKVVDSKVTSYSSEYWTDKALARNENSTNWTVAYNLSDFGSIYQSMGDPFIVQIPSDLIQEGENNFIRIGTGLAPRNSTGGSDFDRVIYTARLKGSVGYGNVFNTSENAINDARQRLINKISSYVNVSAEDIQIENQSISGIKLLWGPSLMKVITWEK